MKSIDKYCISVKDLKKNYKNKTNVIDGISFNVGYGTVFGFLGTNGAGKTTTVKILTSLIKPSSGIIKVFGLDLNKQSASIKRRIGLVLQQPSYESRLTVEQSLDFYGYCWGIKSNERRKKIKELIHDFDLHSIRNTLNDELSIGQRRRVQIAREFINDIELIFLDEPTIGLDPQARRKLLDYLKQQVKSGLTIFLTTHIMEEAEYLCDNIAILDKGRIVALGAPSDLKQKYGSAKDVEIRLKECIPEKLLSTIVHILDFNSHFKVIDSNTIRINTANFEKVIIEIISLLSSQKILIDNIAITSPSLEDIFLKVINNKFT